MLVTDLIIASRTHQWIKNLLVFVPLIFSKHLFEGDLFIKTCGAFLIFSLASSGIYIINDLLDRKKDSLHPRKKSRPIASGKISSKVAIIFSILIIGISFALSFFYPVSFTWSILSFIFLNISYSIWLKYVVVVDIISIAFSFVLRVLGGAQAIDIDITNWLLASTFFLAILLALGKRREEIIMLGENAANHRKVLNDYTSTSLNTGMILSAAALFIVYMLYIFNPVTVEKFNEARFIFTVPLVVVGVARYLYIAIVKNIGSPVEAFFRDKTLFIVVMIWTLQVIYLIYSNELTKHFEYFKDILS